MSEAMWIAVIGAGATVVAAWIASRKQHPPVAPGAGASHQGPQPPAGTAQYDEIPVPARSSAANIPSNDLSVDLHARSPPAVGALPASLSTAKTAEKQDSATGRHPESARGGGSPRAVGRLGRRYDRRRRPQRRADQPGRAQKRLPAADQSQESKVRHGAPGVCSEVGAHVLLAPALFGNGRHVFAGNHHRDFALARPRSRVADRP